MKIKNDEIVEIEVIDCNEEFIDIHTETENYIAENLIVHNSRPSKRSIATGIYMPYMKKEELEVIVSVDVSGSINQEELTLFMTEMVNLAKSFNNLKMNVIICDCKIQDTLEVANWNIQKLLDLKIKGGGGTSIKPIIEHIDNGFNNSKIWVHFTDGETDEADITGKPYNTLWVVCKEGTTNVLEKCGGEIIKLDD